MKPRTVTVDTEIHVLMKGEHGIYCFAAVNGSSTLIGPLGSVANTLADLTGHTSGHIESILLDRLPFRYGVEIPLPPTQLGIRSCPIQFLVTLEQ